jgi:hypothetical protein
MEVLENEYWSIMNHAFLLKHYGGISIAEQNLMTYEDRKWWLNRINEEREKQNKNASAPDSSRQHTPGQPPI